jgi:NAD(P)-dependent dehydrogenase (short-subunit alcohol dehydrogenase family)
VSSQSLHPELSIQRSAVRLQFLPEPDRLEITLPEHHICLLTDDGSLATAKLARSLREQGWKTTVLSFPQSLINKTSSLPEGVERVVLADLKEDSLKQQLATIAANYGPIGAFIHLHPLFRGNQNDGICFPEAEKAILKQVFFMAKHLKSSLNRAANLGYGCFLTVARLDGAFGLEQKINFSPIAAGLFGLTKSLNQEWKSVFCRAIDLSPELTNEQMSQYILAELHDPNRCLTEVGYSSGGRANLTTIS